jgi:hypothetical protein
MTGIDTVIRRHGNRDITWSSQGMLETSWDFEITKILWFRCWNITQICMYLKWYCCGLSHHVYYVPEQYNGFLVLVDCVNSYVFPMLLRFLFFYFFLSLEQYIKFSHGDRYVCNCRTIQTEKISGMGWHVDCFWIQEEIRHSLQNITPQHCSTFLLHWLLQKTQGMY